MTLNKSLVFFVNQTHFKAGFTTNIGGVNPLWGLNLGLNTNQNPHEIDQNRSLFKNILGKNYDYAFAAQVHSSKVQEIDKGGIYEGIDGFVTNKKDLVINILTADCLGIIAIDKDHEVIGVFHAGWKGTAEKIVQKGIEKMIRLGANEKNIEVYIAPGIKSQDYEVGEDLKKYFPHSSFEKNREKLCFNLEKENIRQLNEIGIFQIVFTPYSTFQEKALYSYRRDAQKAGRFASFAVISSI